MYQQKNWKYFSYLAHKQANRYSHNVNPLKWNCKG